MKSHESLYEAEREKIEDWAASAWQEDRWVSASKLIVIVDLRSAFGRSLGLHLLDRAALDRRIRGALAIAAVPSLSIPVRLEHGEALVDEIAPELLGQLRARPPGTVPMLLVDATDAPRIGLAFLRGPAVLLN